MPHTPPLLARFTRNILPTMQRETSGQRMVRDVKRLVSTERWNSFDRFHETTKTLARVYESAGAAVEVYSAPTGGPIGSGRWIIPEAADIRAARAEIVSPIKRPLLDYRDNPWHVIQWSAATAPQGMTCDLAVIDTDEQLTRVTSGGLAGKIVLTRLNVWKKRRELCDKGAGGVISDAPVAELPRAVGWTKFGWGGLDLADCQARLVGLAISAHEGEKLRKLFEKHGKVRIKIRVDIRRYAGAHDVISGIIRGRDDPQDEVWAVAHSAEPGALDNASGVAVCIEIARILRRLIDRGVLPPPRRTIRLLHGYECYGFFHYLEHQKRFQSPLAGVCIDTVGAKPELCRGELRWHATIPQSAGFVDDVGAAMLRAALRRGGQGRPPYRLARRPFVTTEDTLLGDPKFGFPCPWITNHPFRGYHSSADTPALLHRKGLTACAAAMAGYLYYLADAATDEALELAGWETEQAEARLRELRLKRNKSEQRRQVEFARCRHGVALERLKRWLWGGERAAILARFAEFERRVDEAAPEIAGARRRRSLVPRRTAPLAPTLENTPPEIAKRLQALPKWAAYWADGSRSLAEIADLLSVELGRKIDQRATLECFKALSDLKYVELIGPKEMISKARLIADFKKLGIRPGMDVMIHSSLSKAGPIAGGAETVIDALLAAIGKNGTLLAPSFNHFSARVFNPLTTPTTNGAIPDALWRRAEAVRSLHPSHSVCAIGPKAEAYCEGHLENGIWAHNSPIGRLVHGGGYILSLGVRHDSSTAYHIGEISLNCGCLDQFGSRDRVVMPDGRVQEVRGLAWRAGNCPVHPRKIDKTLDRRKLQRHGTIGMAHATLVLAIEVWKARREHLKGVCPGCSIEPQRRDA